MDWHIGRMIDVAVLNEARWIRPGVSPQLTTRLASDAKQRTAPIRPHGSPY